MAPFSLEFENEKGNLARKELNLKFRYVLASKNDVFAWHISHIAHGCLCYIMITHTFKWEGRSDGQCRKRCISLFNIALVKEWVAGVGRGYFDLLSRSFGCLARLIEIRLARMSVAGPRGWRLGIEKGGGGTRNLLCISPFSLSPPTRLFSGSNLPFPPLLFSLRCLILILTLSIAYWPCHT